MRLSLNNFGVSIAGLLFTSTLFAQTSASIKTAQTTIVVQAGAQAPRLLSVQAGSAKAWANSAPEALIPSIEQDGHTLPLKWKLNNRESRVTARKATFVYESDSPHLRLSWSWEARATSGPIEHGIQIENLSGTEIWLPMQDSFRFRFPVDGQLHHAYVEKGAGKPSNVGTHEVAVPAGYAWTGRSSTYARNQDEREVIPFSMVERDDAAHDGWYVGIEFSGRTRIALERDGASLRGDVGLDPEPGPFRTRLMPHESLQTPLPYFSAHFAAAPDGAGNVLRPLGARRAQQSGHLEGPQTIRCW